MGRGLWFPPTVTEKKDFAFMHTIFVAEIPEMPGSTVPLSDRESNHFFKVLRGAPGDRVRLLDGRGGRGEAEALPGRQMTLLSREQVPEPPQKLFLYCALPRRAKFDVLLKQAAELGVWQITPVLCERSVSEGNSPERWEVLLQEGCKQSGNPFLPRIAAPLRFADALADAEKSQCRVFFGSVAQAELPRGGEGSTAWFVGPEGGFAPAEEALLRERAIPLNLGPYILRLETAAVCGLAALRLLMRKVPLLLCLGAAMLLVAGAGCSDRDPGKHPLMVKGKKAAANGDYDTARRMFSHLTAKFPESPAAHLALATVLDEGLDDPAGALYHYDETLRLSGGSGDHEVLLASRALVKARLLEKLKGEGVVSPSQQKIEALEKENAALRAADRRMKQMLLVQNRKIAELEQAQSGTPRRYRVKAGDTPGSIARKNRITSAELMRFNRLPESAPLRVGQEILIPSGRR